MNSKILRVCCRPFKSSYGWRCRGVYETDNEQNAERIFEKKQSVLQNKTRQVYLFIDAAGHCVFCNI